MGLSASFPYRNRNPSVFQRRSKTRLAAAAGMTAAITTTAATDHTAELSDKAWLPHCRPASASPPPAPAPPIWSAAVADALLDDLEILVKHLHSKQMQKDSKIKLPAGADNNNNFDSFSDAGWSREISPSEVLWDETGPDYALFLKELAGLRARVDAARSREQVFDGQMALGRALYEHNLFREALTSFRRACELQPTDVRPHLRRRQHREEEAPASSPASPCSRPREEEAPPSSPASLRSRPGEVEALPSSDPILSEISWMLEAQKKQLCGSDP